MVVSGTKSEDLEAAAQLVRSGGLVVFPTETVYGLGANALSPQAVSKVFIAKGRPSDNPLIVHVADGENLMKVVRDVPPTAKLLMESFWPGPLTIVLERSSLLAENVTAGLKTVGVRWPRLPLAQEFLLECGVPVAAPSANRSGEPSPTTYLMAYNAMYGRVDAILRGPDCEVGLESTVVGFVDGNPKIYRCGGVTPEELADVLKCEVASLFGELTGPPPSPGLTHPHYRPRAKVEIFVTSEDLQEASSSDWAIGPKELLSGFCGNRRTVTNLQEYARRLFSTFAEADRAGATTMWCWLPPENGLGAALRDRLMRAAGKW